VTLPLLDAAALDAARVPPLRAIAAIEAALAAAARGAAQQPHPPALRPAGGGFFQPLLAALPQDDVACVNWLTYHPGNPARGLPHSGGLLILSAFATGTPLCVMDGIWISHRRTGYVAALAAKYLAGAAGDVALIGAGAIAMFAVEALAALGLLRGELRVASRTPEGAARFCAEAAARLGVRARAVAEARAAVEGARLVVTATSHEGPPFLERAWLADGALVVLIDRLRVVTPDVLASAARIVTTSRDSLAGWGFSAEHRVQLLQEIIAGGRPSPVAPGTVTLCDAAGVAVADLAFAALVWRELQAARA